MQTEDVNTGTLDEPSALIHSDTEMTVKEEIEDHPAETPITTSTVLLCEGVVDEPDCTDTFSIKDNQATHLISPSQDNEDIEECSSTFPPQGARASSVAGSEQKNDRGRGRGRRRSRWKLKFHHQALPPEYLDHYEASMAQQDAAAAAAKSLTIKSENRSKTSGSGSAKSVPALAPRLSPSENASSTQCFIKIEPDQPTAQQFIANTNAIDQMHILPVQTLSIGNDSEFLSRLQRDVVISNKDDSTSISEKPTMLNGRVNQSNNNKGLLSTLLANSAGSVDIGNKNITEVERKRRSSVIMSSSTGSNVNNLPPVGVSGSGNSSKIVNYQDLPYMGEITLDNMKPRRGRKPKKADICHLIYKNYGTIFPGTPPKAELEEWPRRKAEPSQNLSSPSSVSNTGSSKKSETVHTSHLKCKPFEMLKSGGQLNHSDVQNRIISSLLEKRLTAVTQEAKKGIFNHMDFTPSLHFDRPETSNIVNSDNDAWNLNTKRTSLSSNASDEPLNLCVKDLNQLKIRLLRKHGNFYEPRSNDVSVKNEPPSPSDVEELEMQDPQADEIPKFLEEAVTHETRTQTPLSFHRQDNENTSETLPFPVNECPPAPITPLLPLDAGTPTGSPLPGGYIYWPSAGVFVHPMALQSQLMYYQKMGAIPLVPISPTEQSPVFLPSPLPQINLASHANPCPASSSQTSSLKSSQVKEQKPNSSKTQIPKAFSMMMDAGTKSPTVTSEVTFPRMKRLAPLGNPPAVGAPTKRKRSAIFIPPMPSENSTNPTTEVSICKFKFTGGAKPSLQEKKMLSVDSGGNFRYYSGTGDKSMRGYEFFPRESLQQPLGSSMGSSSEQFLAASALGSGEKVVSNTNLAFIPDDQRSIHLKQLSGSTDTAVKAGIECSQTSGETGSLMTGNNSQAYDHQAPGASNIKKKPNVPLKGRSFSNIEADKSAPATTTDIDQNCHSQFRLRKKRKTRKSLAREKLEQTFKEKGFLIQTQQLESAEGATYCKFRQLRKFTRYLFRSWKDYLPGNVREMSVIAGVAGSPASESGQVDSEVEGELSSGSSPTPQVVDSSPQLPNT